MSRQKVSVIIPAYKAAGTIRRALESLVRQTRRPDEILVVDDGSPDDLAEAVRPYGGTVTLVRKSNGGAASARNAGIERATGEMIAFLDADDYWEPTKLGRQLDIFLAHPEVGLVGTDLFVELPGQPRRRLERTKTELSLFGKVLRPVGPEAFRLACYILTSTVLVRSEILAAERFQSGLEPAEDRDLWVRMATRAPVFLLPEPLITYVEESGSLSRSNLDRDCGNMLRVVHRHAGLLGSSGLREQEAIVFRRWAGGHMANGQPTAAVRPAWKRLRIEPWSIHAWWIMLKSLVLNAKARVG
jgi:glycosyltransferase involved in cell wall biosynthesis